MTHEERTKRDEITAEMLPLLERLESQYGDRIAPDLIADLRKLYNRLKAL